MLLQLLVDLTLLVSPELTTHYESILIDILP